MKTLLKIGLAFVLLTATIQAGRAAIKHYAFVDAVQEAMLFASSWTEDDVAERVIAIADEHLVPIDPETLEVRRQPFLVEIVAPYEDTVNLLPGVYTHTWNFEANVSVRLLNDTRPRSSNPRTSRRR